jgi:transcriptional regulator with XRE-family HTH domain
VSEGRRPITDDEREGWQTFGGLLAGTRVKAGVSQRQLAVVAGIGLRHMQRIEAGERRARMSRLVRMTDFLARFLDGGPESIEELEEHSDCIIGALLEMSGVTLAPESEHQDRAEVQRRQRARARRAWFEMTGPDRRKIRQRRAVGEEQRRRARATLHAAREHADLDPWQAWPPGM